MQAKQGLLTILKRSGYLEWCAFFMVAILGFGSSFYWIKVAVRDISPLELVAYRSSIAAIFLWSVVWFTKTPVPKNLRIIAKIVCAGIVGGALPNALISWGEYYVHSSIAGVLIGLCPVFTILLSWLFISGTELSKARMLGVIIGFAGVYVILSPKLDARLIVTQVVPELAIVLAAICYSVFSVFAKINFTKQHPIALAAISSTASAVFMLSVALYNNNTLHLPSNYGVWCAVLWIGVITGALSQILIYHLIRAWGAARLAMITYLMPVVAVLLGIFALGERLELQTTIGAAIIMLSIYMVNRKGSRVPERWWKIGSFTANEKKFPTA
ncbi:MAG: DMT family transporter [Proteobacteria bacterium]|nr:DMT family transporter [Pseudomonadota bacterium]